MQYEHGPLRRNLPVIVAAAVLVVAFFATAWVNGLLEQAQSSVRNEISQVEAQVTLAEDAKKNEQRISEATAAGMSLDRISDDTGMFGDMLKDMCTWNSKESYDAMRARMLGEYKVPEDSWLMQEFLPVVENGRNADGIDTGNIIDNRGYNMQLVDYDVRCLSAADGTYSYFAEAKVASGFKDQVGESLCAFFFDVGADGKLASIDGMPVSM